MTAEWAGYETLEALANAPQQYTVEYELGSECRMPSLFDYADGNIICAGMNTEKSRVGLWLALLSIADLRRK